MKKQIILVGLLILTLACTLEQPEPNQAPKNFPYEAPVTLSKDKHSANTPARAILPSDDLLYLARLCVMKVRGLRSLSQEACLSVVSTALTRTERRFMSDGTIASTLGWHSGETWQFAGYLVDGCSSEMLPASCPDRYPRLIVEYETLIRNYLRGESSVQPRCERYLFYNSIPGGNADCLIIDSESGQFIEFYKQASAPTPRPEGLPKE